MIEKFSKFELSTKKTSAIKGGLVLGGPLQDKLDQYAKDSENENWGEQAQQQEEIYNWFPGGIA